MKRTMQIDGRPVAHNLTLSLTRRNLKRYVLPLLLALPVALIWGCSDSGDTGSKEKTVAIKTAEKAAAVVLDGDPVAGRTIYEQHCRYCHGSKGLGDGAIGIALDPQPANFVTETKRMARPDKELYDSIADGMQLADLKYGEGMAMPAWKSILSAQQMWDVLAYVRELERTGKKTR